MINIRKVTQLEIIKFLEEKYPELRREVTKQHGYNPVIFSKMRVLLVKGELEAFLRTKGFKNARVWILRRGGRGILKGGGWMLLSGEAA